MTSTFKPTMLHVVSHHVSYLDHRIVPELGACFAAMMSRVPKGGIMARYKEVVEKTAKEIWANRVEDSQKASPPEDSRRLPSWDKAILSPTYDMSSVYRKAEERLTQYPLPLCVHNPKFDTKSYNRETKVDKNGEKPGFINLNVALYGHGCYDPDTEALIYINGELKWEKWPEIYRLWKAGEKFYGKTIFRIAAYDPDSDSMRLVKPSDVIRKEHTGKMYEIRKEKGGIDLLLTPDHRVYVSKRTYLGKGVGYKWMDFEVRRAEDIAGKTSFRMKKTASCLRGGKKVDDPWSLMGRDAFTFGRLVGFFLGDGYAGGKQASYLSFHLTKTRKKEYLNGIIETLGVEAKYGTCKSNGRQKIHMSLEGARDWARSNFYSDNPSEIGYAYDKVMPAWCLGSNEEFRAGLLDGLRNSDGSHISTNSWVYSTTSRQLADMLQILGTVSGHPVSISNLPGNTENSKEKYILFVQDPSKSTPVWNRGAHRQDDRWVEYDGAVYCATVPSGLLFVRRNGSVVISGNSIKEMTGNPVVFVEHISWWFAYLTFDNPLVSGQEMSTRAVWRRDWPMAKDAATEANFWLGPKEYVGKIPERRPLGDRLTEEESAKWDPANMTEAGRAPSEALREMHNLGLEIAWHETEAWKVELKLPCPRCAGDGILTYKYNTEQSRSWVHFNGETIGEIYLVYGKDPAAWVIKPMGGKDGNITFPRVTMALDALLELHIEIQNCRSKPHSARDVAKVHQEYEKRVAQTAPCSPDRECPSCVGTGKKYPWMNDPQAFRPAFDRARHALPGTFETGVAHTASVRVMGRVLKVMRDLATASGQQSALKIIAEMETAYSLAIPGMAGMWLREAVHDSSPIVMQTGTVEYVKRSLSEDGTGALSDAFASEAFLPKDDPNKFGSEHPDHDPYLNDPVVGAMVDAFATTPFTVTEDVAVKIRAGGVPEDSEIGEHIPDMEGSPYLESEDRSVVHGEQPDGTPWTKEAVDSTSWPIGTSVAGESTNVTETKVYESDMAQGMAGVSNDVIRPDEIDDHMSMVRSGMEEGLGLPSGTLDALGVPDEFLRGSTEFSTSDIYMRVLDNGNKLDSKHLFTIMSIDGMLKSEEGEFIGWIKNLKEIQTAGTDQTSLTMTVVRDGIHAAGMIDRLIDQDYPMEIHTLEYIYRGCWASLCTGIEIDKENGTYADCDVQYVSKEKWDNGNAENDSLEDMMVKQDDIILGEISQSLLSTEVIEALDDLHSAVVDGKRYSTNEVGKHAVSVSSITNIVHDEIHATIPATDMEDAKEKITDPMNERSPGWDNIVPIPTGENIYLPTGTPRKPATTFREAQAIVDERERRRTAMDQLPGNISFLMAGDIYTKDGPDTEVCTTTLRDFNDLKSANVKHRRTRREYVDDYFNSFARVDMTIRCSLAAARDWHRHRTAMPWQIRVVRNNEGSIAHLDNGTTMMMNLVAGTLVRGDTVTLGGDKLLVVRVEKLKGPLQIDHHYAPISEFGKANHDRYMEMCTALFDKYMSEGNQWMAMLCLPLGTRVEMRGQAGLKDAIYLLELRSFTKGANWEYQEQALSMLKSLTTFIDSNESDILTSALKLNQEFSS